MVKTRKIIKTQKDIQKFLIACGFDRSYSYLNHIGHYLKDIDGDELYIYQIDGEGLQDIESIDSPVTFTENGKDSSITPLFRYSVEYPNLKAMVEEETKRGIDFSEGLKKWKIE